MSSNISCSCDISSMLGLLFLNILVKVQIEQILPFVSVFGSRFSSSQALILRALANHQKLSIFLEYNLFSGLT